MCCKIFAHQHWKSHNSFTYNILKTCKNCVQLCFSPSNTLYLHHVLMHYSLLLTVTLIVLRVSLGVNLKLI